MSESILTGKWALVTGTSSGLGVDFARELAGRGMNMVLVARREEKLRQVQEEIIRDFEVEVIIVPFDLAGKNAPGELSKKIREMGLEIEVLINNAGFGIFGEFLEADYQTEQDMLQLNMATLTGLTKIYAREMQERGSGYIMLVASNGAYQPSPGYAAYSATKSYVLSLGEAVNYELKDSPVSLTVVSPGPTRTEFHDVTGQGRDNLYLKLATMESENVTRIGIKAMLKGKPSVIPGWLNAVLAWSAQRMPRRIATASAAWMMGI
jgi:uncharacterized protein